MTSLITRSTLTALLGLVVALEASAKLTLDNFGTSLDWQLSRFAKITGNVLTVDVPPDRAKEGGSAIATVDLSAVDGRSFSASVRCRGENISKPFETWNGLKFQFEFKNPTTGEMTYPNTKSRLGTFPEETIRTTVADAGGRLDVVKLTLGLQSSSGKVVFDLSTLKIRSGCDLYPLTNGDYRVSYPAHVKALPQLRGVMLPGGACKEDDFRTLKEWGATLARYQMIRNWNARNSDRDVDEYMRWLDGKLDHLDREVLPWAEKYGVRIVVDLHVPPGGRSAGGDMNMFYERKYNDAFVDCWRKIARRFKGRKMIYGYDLINEPQQTDKAVCDYWNTQRRAAEAVREIDPDVTIVMESNGWDSSGTYSYLSPLAMDNVIYQVHMYEPFVFTHQGVHQGCGRATYPDEAKGWNRAFLEQRLAPVLEFQKKHKARIYVGEFSAAAWAPGAEHYLSDLISIFNECGWDWTYHAFREWPGWSVEHVASEPGDCKPSADNPRMRVLKDALGRRTDAARRASPEAVARRKAAIRATPNLIVPSGAVCRYVSAKDGDDRADGTSPATAWRTLERLKKDDLRPGSFVLLERGGVYRGTVRTCPGCTYTAYGEGPKPCVYGSPEDGADPSKWHQTDNPKVWAYDIGHRDVGSVVFDGGASHAIKVLIRTDRKTGAKTDQRTGRTFNSHRDLSRDLDFWHDYYEGGTGRLYMRSEENPGRRFKSIEFGVKCAGVSVGTRPGVTVDNLCIKYVGGHGVGAGTCRNLTVSNCEFAWIGGSIQGEAMFGRDHPTRYGNGVEIYGGCDGYVVTNCLFSQVYDAAVTHQFNVPTNAGTKRYDQKNVLYADNVIVNCNYSFEFFLRAPKGNLSRMEDVLIRDNICLDSGFGFCEERPDKGGSAHVKSWRGPGKDRTVNCVIRDNVFQGAKDKVLDLGEGFVVR